MRVIACVQRNTDLAAVFAWKVGSASDTEGAPPHLGRGRVHEQPAASRRKVKSHSQARPVRALGGTSVQGTAPCRECDLTQRIEAQEGQRGTPDTQCCVPDMRTSNAF